MKIPELIKLLENVKCKFGENTEVYTRVTDWENSEEYENIYSPSNCSVKSQLNNEGGLDKPKFYIVDMDIEDLK